MYISPLLHPKNFATLRILSPKSLRKSAPGFLILLHTGHGPFRTGAEALHTALEATRSHHGDALLIGCEKMTHLSAAQFSGLLAPRVSTPLEQHYGATLPALSALTTTVYMRGYRVPRSALDTVSVKNHAHGMFNPRAHFQKTVSLADVALSPMISDPLRRLHCAPVSDGAVACIVGAGAGNITFTGWARGEDATRFQDRKHLARFPAARDATRRVLEQTGYSIESVDVVEIHDAFTSFELMNLEEMGFSHMGQAWRDLRDGHFEIGGRVAVNPSGGMKARGHPIGVCGLTSLYEINAQLRGQAAARQHPNARVAMIQSAGGVAPDSYVFALEAC